MTTKLNIFNALPAAHHSEDEDEFDTTATGDNTKPKEKRVRNRGKKQETDAQPTKTPAGHANREHDLKKATNDLDHPHKLDRKSGTGQSAFDKKEKKEGRGKGNWGNFKDDGKRTKEEGDETQEVELPVTEEEDKTITLDEYLGSKASNQSNKAVNDVKAKISDEQLKKELGKATLLETRKTNKNDDKQETHKKNEATAITGMNTEHANLLGFRTGFKTYDESKKRENRDRDYNRGEKRERPQRNKEEEGQATEETTPAEQTEQTEQTTEVQQPAEGEQAAETSPSQHRGGNRGARRGSNRGGYRAENGEGRTERGAYRGSRRGGDRREGQGERREGQGERGEGQGERKPYQGQGERKPYQGQGERKPYQGQGERKPYQGQGENKEGQTERKEHQGERKEHQGERKEFQGERREAQGTRGGYRGNNKANKGFNVEDESAFPKLG